VGTADRTVVTYRSFGVAFDLPILRPVFSLFFTGKRRRR
jgi:hypothetical protein